jgi:hypothetical protein
MAIITTPNQNDKDAAGQCYAIKQKTHIIKKRFPCSNKLWATNPISDKAK